MTALVLWFAERVYKVLLFACPASFRRAYGGEMTALFRLRCERATSRSGRAGLLACAVRGCLDVLAVGMAGRLSRQPTLARSPYRAARGDAVPTRLLVDFRLAFRTFARQPLFTTTVVATLAIGIGATTTMFGIVDGAVLRPLRYPAADRLVSLVQKDQRFGTVAFGPPYLADFRAGMHTVERLAGFSPSWLHALTGSGEARLTTAAFVSDGLFELFGAAPIRGRIFRPDEHVPGGPRVAVVSEGFWNRQFGSLSTSNPIIRLDGAAYTVVGVMPDSLRMPITASSVSRTTASAEIWLPFSLNPYATARTIPVMNIVGRLRDGATPSAAQQEMASLAGTLARDNPALTAANLQVTTLASLVARDTRAPLLVLLAAVGVLLLVTCANVGHMLLARSAGRESEMALRASLGATPARLALQLLVESATLAAAGGAAGLALAWWALGAVPSLGGAWLPPSTHLTLDWRVAAVAAAIAAVTAVLVGVLPAIGAARHHGFGVLREGARAVGGRGHALRAGFVFAEVTLAVVLLVGAGLLARSFMLLTAVEPGFSADRVLAGATALPQARYPTPEVRLAFADRALQELGTLPGVERAALVNRLPFGGGNVLVGVEIEGQPQVGDAPAPMDRRVVSPGYFAAMGIPVLEGRSFTADDRAGAAESVAIVNATVARRFWPGAHAVGRRLRLMLRAGPGPWLRIVGVVGDVRHHGLDQPPQPEVYVPYAQAPVEAFVLLVRTSAEPTRLAPAMRAEIWQLDPELPVDPMGSASDAIRASVAEPRMRTAVINAFALVALLLAAMGVYGVLSFSVTQRTRDIGVRIALGASRASILKMVLGQGLGIVAAGVAAGLAASFLATKLLQRLLFGVTPTDPLTFVAVATVLLAVALFASYLPARRAMRLDPVRALRVE